MGHIFFILDLDDGNAYLVISHVLYVWLRQLFDSSELDFTTSAKKKEKHEKVHSSMSTFATACSQMGRALKGNDIINVLCVLE